MQILVALDSVEGIRTDETRAARKALVTEAVSLLEQVDEYKGAFSNSSSETSSNSDASHDSDAESSFPAQAESSASHAEEEATPSSSSAAVVDEPKAYSASDLLDELVGEIDADSQAITDNSAQSTVNNGDVSVAPSGPVEESSVAIESPSISEEKVSDSIEEEADLFGLREFQVPVAEAQSPSTVPISERSNSEKVAVLIESAEDTQ